MRTYRHLGSSSIFQATFLALILALGSGCTGLGKRSSPPSPEQQSPNDTAAKAPMDLATLARSLRLDRSIQDLGYEEASFDPCETGHSTPARGCHRQTLVSLHFQLQCRDTEGSASSIESYEVTPVVSDGVRWNLGPLQGQTSTDREGFGQITHIFPSSMRNQKVRLTINGRYLIVHVGQIRKIVTPSTWCTHSAR